MEALPSIHHHHHHHHHQPLSSSTHYSCPSSITPSAYSSLFRSPTASSSSSSSSSSSPSVRASSSPSPPSSDPLPQNRQYPEAKIPQFLNPLPKVSSFDPPLRNLQYPEAKSIQFFNPLCKVPSFVSITAASAFLFLGFCQNGLISKPITTLSSGVSIEEALDEESNIEEFIGSKSILHLKLKEKVPVVHSFKKTKTDDDEAWQVLKAQVFSCSEQLELVKMGFEEILEKDQDCSKPYEESVLEYLEVVDECKGLLKGVKLAMDWCEREKDDVKRYLRFFNNVVSRIRVLEGDMVGALKHLKELGQE